MKTKKISIFICTLLATLFVLSPVNALANSNESVLNDNQEVQYNGTPETASGGALYLRTSGTKDLSEGSVGISISDFEAGTTRVSDYYYKTNSTYIYFYIYSDISTSYTISLYDKNGTMIGTQTRTVGTLGNDYKFTSLSSTQTYYFKIKNNGSSTTTLTGEVNQLFE